MEVDTIPTSHGITIGEFGRLWSRDQNLTALVVIPMVGWERPMTYDVTGLPWVFPSPNLPTLDSVAMYPATCLVEGTTLSVGRGGRPSVRDRGRAVDCRLKRSPTTLSSEGCPESPPVRCTSHPCSPSMRASVVAVSSS